MCLDPIDGTEQSHIFGLRLLRLSDCRPIGERSNELTCRSTVHPFARDLQVDGAPADRSCVGRSKSAEAICASASRRLDLQVPADNRRLGVSSPCSRLDLGRFDQASISLLERGSSSMSSAQLSAPGVPTAAVTVDSSQTKIAPAANPARFGAAPTSPAAFIHVPFIDVLLPRLGVFRPAPVASISSSALSRQSATSACLCRPSGCRTKLSPPTR